MNAPDKAFLAREYNNRELVPEHPQFFARWGETSLRARSRMLSYLDRRYGEMPGETIDLFPARKGDGSCMMFIHGGYWRSLDKQDFSFLAPAWVDAGVSLAVVNYDLCPKVTMEEIARQMLRASRWLWLHAEQYGMDQDRLYVSGHSAGGHLAAMLMCALWPVFDARLPKDLWKGGLAISGLYDLRPLLQVDFLQQDLRLDEAAALNHVAGYCVVNDVSERAFQMATSQWDKGKGFDSAGPIGPWLVTSDEIRDPQNLDMWLDVNGKRMQTGNTRTMVFNVAKIISHVSHYMTLLPGDIIATGTPPGVGLGIKPTPVFLKPGDVMTLRIQGLGEQRQRVVAHSA